MTCPDCGAPLMRVGNTPLTHAPWWWPLYRCAAGHPWRLEWLVERKMQRQQIEGSKSRV